MSDKKRIKNLYRIVARVRCKQPGGSAVITLIYNQAARKMISASGSRQNKETKN